MSQDLTVYGLRSTELVGVGAREPALAFVDNRAAMLAHSAVLALFLALFVALFAAGSRLLGTVGILLFGAMTALCLYHASTGALVALTPTRIVSRAVGVIAELDWNDVTCAETLRDRGGRYLAIRSCDGGAVRWSGQRRTRALGWLSIMQPRNKRGVEVLRYYAAEFSADVGRRGSHHRGVPHVGDSPQRDRNCRRTRTPLPRAKRSRQALGRFAREASTHDPGRCSPSIHAPTDGCVRY